MTKKPPKTLWVNVYKGERGCDGYGNQRKKYAIGFRELKLNVTGYIGTFKYVLEDKGKK